MPWKSAKKERGVFEKDSVSEIWWIRYYIDDGSAARRTPATCNKIRKHNQAAIESWILK